MIAAHGWAAPRSTPVTNRALLPIAATAAAAAVLFAAAPAHAVNCADLPNPIYLQVGDTQEPLMKSLGQQLRESAVHPMTIVYLTSGSCTNIDAFYNDTLLTQNPKYVPSAAEDPTWIDVVATGWTAQGSADSLCHQRCRKSADLLEDTGVLLDKPTDAAECAFEKLFPLKLAKLALKFILELAFA